MRWTAPEDREQGRAGSLHPEGQCFVDQTWTEHGADFPDRFAGRAARQDRGV
jgi:hypothetical protein